MHLVRGELSVNGTRLAAGDAARLQRETRLTLSDGKDAEAMIRAYPRDRAALHEQLMQRRAELIAQNT